MGCFMLKNKNKTLCLYKKEASSVSVFISRKVTRKRLQFSLYSFVLLDKKTDILKSALNKNKEKKKYTKENSKGRGQGK